MGEQCLVEEECNFGSQSVVGLVLPLALIEIEVVVVHPDNSVSDVQQLLRNSGADES